MRTARRNRTRRNDGRGTAAGATTESVGVPGSALPSGRMTIPGCPSEVKPGACPHGRSGKYTTGGVGGSAVL